MPSTFVSVFRERSLGETGPRSRSSSGFAASAKSNATRSQYVVDFDTPTTTWRSSSVIDHPPATEGNRPANGYQVRPPGASQLHTGGQQTIPKLEREPRHLTCRRNGFPLDAATPGRSSDEARFAGPNLDIWTVGTSP